MAKKSKRIQSQDKPQTKLRMANRRARLTKLFAEGKSVREAAQQLRAEGYAGASDANVGFDLQALSREAPKQVELARAEAESELRALKKFVAEADDMSSAETVQNLLAIHDRIARLLGLDAPTKSMSAHITADVDPSKLVGYRRFVAETQLLNEEQLERVFEFARSLKPEVVDASTRFRPVS